MIKQVSMPEDLNTFISTAGDIFLKPLYALSAAESLTDEVALQLAVKSGLEEIVARKFVKALHFSDFVVERNSEWNFTSQARSYLNEHLIAQGTFCAEMHSLLLEISITSNPRCAGETVPRYLLTDVGKAYHISPSSPADGLKLYAAAAKMELTGTQWLLGKLAIEQQQSGILPSDAIEPSFIRGMTLYRESRVNEAEIYLRRVIRSKEIRQEVAIACHLIGKIESKKPGMQANAEALLRRSLALLEKLHDQHGQAQALHSLGQLIGKDHNRVSEAEALLRRSLELDKTEHGKAQALHSLGQLIGKDHNRVSEAEALLRRSLEIGENIRHEHHQAQALHSLGQLIGKDRNRVSEAEALLRRSLEIGENIRHEHHQAQALHSLGQLIGKDHNRVSEAEALLRWSLVILERLHDRNGQAQVLFSLGRTIWEIKQTEAEQMFRRSIVLNRELKNGWALRMVQKELDNRLKKQK